MLGDSARLETSPAERSAAIEANLENGFRLGDVIVEPKRERVIRAGQDIHLEPKVMRVLLMLAAYAGQPVSRAELLETVWADTVVGDEVLSRAVSLLRAALGDERKDPSFIRTLPRQGYELIVTPSPLGARSARRRRVAGPALVVAALLTVTAIWWMNRNAELPVLVLMPIEPKTEALGGAATGISDDLYDLLGRARGVRPLARRWSFGLRDSPLPPSGIAERFGADYIVAGELEKSMETFSLRLELVALPDGSSLWSQRFEARDLTSLRQAVLGPARSAMNRHLDAGIQQAQIVTSPVSERAYLNYLQARHHWSLRGSAHIARAAELLASSIEAAPEFAEARLALAQVYALQPFYSDLPVPEQFARARAQLRTALDVDPTLTAAANALEGFMRLRARDWSGATEALKMALQSNPNDPLAHYWMAMLLSALNQHPAALSHARRAAELAPTSPAVLDRLGVNELWAGNLAAAGKAFTDARSLGYAEGTQSKAYIIYLIRTRAYADLKTTLRQLGVELAWVDAFIAALRGGTADPAFIAYTDEVLEDGRLPAEFAFGTWVVLGQAERALDSFDLSLKSPDVELLWAEEGRFLHTNAAFKDLLEKLSLSEKI